MSDVVNGLMMCPIDHGSEVWLRQAITGLAMNPQKTIHHQYDHTILQITKMVLSLSDAS
jgi:hypothetical protein